MAAHRRSFSPLTLLLKQMLRKDCHEAQIETIDGSGRQIDFHALRVTSASILVAGDFDVKLAQQRLGHLDPSLTR